MIRMNKGRLFSLLLVSAGTAFVGCSGHNVSPDGAAGSHVSPEGAAGSQAGGGAGGAGALRPAQGNLTLSVQKSADVSSNCPTPGKSYVVGAPKGPSSVSPGDRLIDGENGASIECSVLGSGPYTFSGTLRGTSSEADTVQVTITNGVIDADGRNGSATISVLTPDLAGTFSSAEGGCAVSVVNQQIKPGSIWAMFSCPSITAAPSGQCAIGATSTFVFENCSGS
jgi:hypothetical protein